ncbi:MAG: EFR1 family ferrodoxin [Sporomusaceae bacterium]|nr:EFR1 family ferrodoxin [Sporomusaceae bacterium]
MIKKLAIFYMTGTGNSYTVALWCAQLGESLGLSATVYSLFDSKGFAATQSGEPLNAAVLCAFAFPTHGFTAPWQVIRAIWRLPRGNHAGAVVLPSRAGTRVQGVALPGMEGTAGYLVALLLSLKGYRVRGVKGIDMPSNWTALHWGMSEENVSSLINRAEAKVKKFVRFIVAGKVSFQGIIPLVVGLVLVPVSLLYLLLGQFFLAKLFFSSEKCSGCGLCAQFCPKQAIMMRGKQEKRPYWRFSCDSCMACMNYCPSQAIEVSPLFVIVFYYLITVPLLTYISHYLVGGYIPSYLGTVLQVGYAFLAVAVAYWLLHQAMRYKPIRKLFSYLCHTRYMRRYHAPGILWAKFQKKQRT